MRQSGRTGCTALGQRNSRNDVGNYPIIEDLDFVLQRKLLLLHPRQLQLVAVPAESQKLNFLVEAAMLGFEKLKHFPRIVVIHVCILQEAPPAVTFNPSTPRRISGPSNGDLA
jgi:hypothetical protein